MERLSVEEIKYLKQKMQSNMNVYFYDEVMKVFDELISYRDAEEQGLLHKAPLKNGTPIWFFQYGFDEGTYLTSGTYLYGVTEYEIGKFKKDFWLSEEEALLANEEAEQALKQMGE